MTQITSRNIIFGFLKPLVDVHTMGLFTMANLLRDCGYIVYIAPDDTVYYNPVSSKFSGKLTAVFASKDSVSYDLLESDDVQNFIYLRPTDSAYMNPEGIMSSFSEYTSLVSMDITADEAGNVSEIVFYRFDK